MKSPRPTDASNAAASNEAVDARLDALSRRSGGGFAAAERTSEGVRQSAFQDASPEWVRLHELLRMPDVEVPEGFADEVIARVQAETQAVGNRRASVWSLAAAFLGAATLLALAVGLGTASDQTSILTTLVSGIGTAALAGAGLVSATWTGVGATVGSWLGTSTTGGTSLALAAMASVGALGWSLRRRATKKRG